MADDSDIEAEFATALISPMPLQTTTQLYDPIQGSMLEKLRKLEAERTPPRRVEMRREIIDGEVVHIFDVPFECIKWPVTRMTFNFKGSE